MKHTLYLIAAAALLAACSSPATAVEAVTKNGGDDTLTEGFTVPSGMTVTINAGATIINNGTATGFGEGTVTSVGLSLPSIFGVSGSPVTTSGSLTATLATQPANKVFAGPTTGSDATPVFRALVASDIPDLSGAYQTLLTFGDGVQAALGANIGSAGAPILFNGAGGTPSSMNGSNITSLNGSNITSGTVATARLDVASQAEAEAGTDAGKVMTPERTAQAIAALAQAPLPRGHIAGMNLVYVNGTSFVVTAGVCRDSTDTYDIKLPANLNNKNPGSAWASGENAGSSDGTGWAAGTNYSVWAILNPTSGAVDVLTSTSATSPTLPTGYTAMRRIGWVRTLAASANMTEWTQFGDLFVIRSSTIEYNAGVTTSTSPVTVYAPPNVLAMLSFIGTATSTWQLRIESTYNFAGAAFASFAVATGAANAADAGQVEIFTDTSSQVYVRAITANTITVNMSCRSWKDRRGRDD